jgi:Zn finger protein HypA/HybF involved in hydrogenase expression
MKVESMRCLNCKEEILASTCAVCPYCGSHRVASKEQYILTVLEGIQKMESAGRFEDAALAYEELEMWDKAGESRRRAKTNYTVTASVSIGKVATINLECPHCNASQPISSKSNQVTCQYCGKNYVIPKRILELL